MSSGIYSSVSVVVCCHDSAARLPETLAHLQAQQVPEMLEWEVVIVDNASTDDTARIANELWAKKPITELRVVAEPHLGLSHARRTGLSAARFEIISIVDDDNWLSPDWIRKTSELMARHPEVGACGGRTEAVTELPPPHWFADYSICYAVGNQYSTEGDVTWPHGHLWGAGMSVRKIAWDRLYADGFNPLLSGRKGKHLTSGEDYELCYALRLAGWHIWYSRDLLLRHYIPASRLSTEYLCRLWKGFGAQTIGHDPYRLYVETIAPPKTLLGQVWARQLVREIFITTLRDRSAWLGWTRHHGDKLRNRINLQRHLGRITELISARSLYDRQITALAAAKWVKLDRLTANDLTRTPDTMNPTTQHLCRKPLVTALICNYNYGRFLTDAVDSALAQSWEPMEVIVVDDGSTDDSRKVLERYGDRIRVILKENGGQASAFNAGIEFARGEIICFLDSDDTWFANKAEEVVRKFQSGDWGLVCHKMEAIYADGSPIPEEDMRYRPDTHLEEGTPTRNLANRGYPWIFAPTSGMSLRADIARSLLPIPEQSWRICADNPLAYGSACFAPTGVIRQPLGQYRNHGSNGFASLRNGGARYSVQLTELQSKRHLYVSKLRSSRSDTLEMDSGIPYPLFRSLCFMASPNPVRHIFQIARRCFRYHLGDGTDGRKRLGHAIYRSCIDSARTILITLNLRSRHREIREQYRLDHAKLDPEVQKLIAITFSIDHFPSTAAKP